jgi:hypothetical protein
MLTGVNICINATINMSINNDEDAQQIYHYQFIPAGNAINQQTAPYSTP